MNYMWNFINPMHLLYLFQSFSDLVCPSFKGISISVNLPPWVESKQLHNSQEIGSL